METHQKKTENGDVSDLSSRLVTKSEEMKGQELTTRSPSSDSRRKNKRNDFNEVMEQLCLDKEKRNGFRQKNGVGSGTVPLKNGRFKIRKLNK